MQRSVLNTLNAHIASARKAAAVMYPKSIKLDMWQAPLCKRFITPFSICTGCPVMAKTGRTHCEGTPRLAIEPALITWEDARAASDGVTAPATTAARKVYKTAVTAWADWLEGLP